MTQVDGTYLLDDVSAGPRTVIVRRVGYRAGAGTVTVTSGGTASLHVALRRDPLALDESGDLGTLSQRRRREVGYTVTTVHAADLAEDAAVTSWQDLLTARVPGLRFTRLSGNVGTGSPMTLRSVSSFAFARTQPVVYLDGIRVNTDPNSGPLLGSGRNVSALDDLGAGDVESVEILGGPAAASLHGADAAAGVILITSKRGTPGAPRFTIATRQGANFMPDPAGRLGEMWLCPYDDFPGGFIPVVGVPPTGTDGLLCNEPDELRRYNMYDEANAYIRSGYFPWPTRALYQAGPSEGYRLEVRGGTESVRYFLSSSYESERGFVPFNRDEAFRLRANVGVALSRGVSVDLSTGYVDGRTRFASPVANSGGEWQDMVWSQGFYLQTVTPFGTNAVANPRTGGFRRRLPSEVLRNESTRAYDRFTGSLTIRHETPPARAGALSAFLTQRAVVGVDKQWDINQNMFPISDGPPASVQSYFLPVGAMTWTAPYTDMPFGAAVYERPITSSLSVNYGLTATLASGDSWSLATSFGAQYESRQVDFFQNAGSGFTSATARTINQITQSSIWTSYSLVESKTVAHWVRQEVAFRDRIFVTGALRVDDNSSYGDLVAPRRFPSVSGSWVVSDEAFWPTDALETVRVRSAWGKAGRLPSPLSNQSLFTGSTGVGGEPVVRPATAGNRRIAPETSTEWEAGLDVEALDARIAASFTRYWRRTEGVIAEIDLPTSVGLPNTMSENLGRIEGRGWQAQVGARLYEGAWLSASVDLAADHVHNEISDLSGYLAPPAFGIGLPYPNELTDDWVVSAQWDPAGPIADGFGRRVSAQCDSGRTLAPDPAAPDAASYGRLPGGAAVSCLTIPNRWIYVGPAFATYTFSVAPRLAFLDDRLQVFALAEGQYGRWRDANDKEFGHLIGNSKIAWTQDDPAWIFGVAVGDDMKRSLFDGSFWRLREVGARLSLSEAFVQDIGASSASLSLSARNLVMIWQAQKRLYGQVLTDPEFGTPTLDGDGNFYETPSYASVNVTLRVGF